MGKVKIYPELKTVKWDGVESELELYTKKSLKEFNPNLSLQEYGKLFSRAKVFKDKFDSWFNQLSSVLYAAAEQGKPAPGTKLVKGRITRKWKDINLVKQHLAEYGHIIYAAKKLKTPAQLEKDIGKEEISELIEETYPIKLATTEDSREEIKSLNAMFKVIK